MKTITVVYIHVPNDEPHVVSAELYVKSVLQFPAGYTHRNLILSQFTMPTAKMQRLFNTLPNCSYQVHDDSGWDIGGFIAAAGEIKDDVMLCLGSSTQVRKAGWLARMMEAWEKHGPGLYGSLSSNQVRPHLNTTGFWCAPEMLRNYPVKVLTKEQRYEFEHGPSAFWIRLHNAGTKVMLVTWDGEYEWNVWRNPPNISCRGTQENCLTYFRINFEYERCKREDLQGRLNYEMLCDAAPLYTANIGMSPTATSQSWDEAAWIEYLLKTRASDRSLQTQKVLHVGCGQGALVDALRIRGINSWGVDDSSVALAQVPERIKSFCRQAKPSDSIAEDYDLIICSKSTAVLAKEDASTLIAEICRHANQVICPDIVADSSTHSPEAGNWIRLFQENGFLRDLHHAPVFATRPTIRFLREKKQPLSVVAFSHETEHSAAGSLRLAGPLARLGRANKLRFHWSNPNFAERKNLSELLAADIFVLQSKFCNGISDPIIAAAREVDKPVVFELDTLLTNVPKAHSNHPFSLAFTPALLAMAREADYITVPTAPLKNCLEATEPKLAGKIHVLPNAIDLELWDGAQLQPDKFTGPFVIGWMGATALDEDFATIKPAIAQLTRKYAGRIVFKFWGALPKSLEGMSGVELVRDWEPDLRQHAREMVKTRIDLAIAPLQDIPYNQSASDIKWLENSICFFPGIYSKVAPYLNSVKHGQTGLLVDDAPEAWVAAIETLMNDHALRRSIAIQAHDEVRKFRSMADNANRMAELYRSFAASGRRPKGSAVHSGSTPQDRAAAHMIMYQSDTYLWQGDSEQAQVLRDQAVYRYVAKDSMSREFIQSAVGRSRNTNSDLKMMAKHQARMAGAHAVAEAGIKDRAIRLYLDAIVALGKNSNPALVYNALMETARAFLTLDQERGRNILKIAGDVIRPFRSPEKEQAIEKLTEEYNQRSNNRNRPKVSKASTAPAKAIVMAPAPAAEKTTVTAEVESNAALQVSIVIPAYDNVAMTRGCLESLAVVKSTITHEIIVINNGSSDGTAEFLLEHQKTHPIRILTFNPNVGFAHASNQGAMAARGQHLIFLNNDTLVTPGWMEALVQAGNQPQTGVVGAKLLYHDGRIQHAGVGFINGFPDHPYRYAAADAPEVNRFRELDMVTGACFLIRAELFRQLAGFDEIYRQGAEDVDLCLRARAAGWKVVYEPKAVIYHLEGQSTGRFDHVNENLRIFFKRWTSSFDKEKNFIPPQPRKVIASSRSLFLQPGASEPTDASIDWIGSFFNHDSLSHVNREMTGSLERTPSLRLKLVSQTKPTESSDWPKLLAKVVTAPSENPSVTVRHQWPPDWKRPRQGALVVMQPWEFGSLPADWVKAASQVDEFWAYTNYVRNIYISSGVDAAKVKVVPLGIDPALFRSDAAARSLVTKKKFKFLFVGGTISRKGPDVLLKAYLENFTAADDVCLVIKDFGGKGVYAGQTLEPQIKAIQANPNAPEICYINEELPAAELPSLYTACDCFVHPYRGEGFGLPILEAMACGLPVIVTAGGSADDFATDEFAYRIPATKRSIGDTVSGMKLAGDGWMLEPDSVALGEKMKWVVANREDARALGLQASSHARQNWTWDRSASVAAERLSVIAQQSKSSSTASPVSIVKKAQPQALPAVAKLGDLTKAEELFRKKSPRAAWEAASEAIRLRPHHPEAFLLLAEIARMVGDSASARACANHSLVLAPLFKPAKKFLKGNFQGNTKLEWLVLPPSIERHAKKAKPTLSVCLIVKNEERFIRQCLASVRDFADQIVVVDTGSTDKTVAIAKEFGAEIHEFKWCDDFSAARNAALQHVTGEWVLSFDADEELPVENREAFRRLLDNESVISWRLPLFDIGRENEGCNYVPRLFRNAPTLHFVGRVHEQVFYSVEARRIEWGLENRIGDAALRHYGYTKELIKERGKIERNLKLLELAIEELPGDPLLHMNLGLELCRSERVDEGVSQYKIAFDVMSQLPVSTVTPETREALLTQYCTYLRVAKRQSELLPVLTSALARQGELTASQHFLLGLAQIELEQFTPAAEQMRLCLEKRGKRNFTPINADILTVIPQHSIALCLWHTKDTKGADEAFRAAILEAPAAAKVHVDYARFLNEQGNPGDALQLLNQFASQNPTEASIWSAGGQIALSQPGLLEVAVDWTTVAIAHHPENPGIIAQRAEALLLSGNLQDALPLWKHVSDRDPKPRALSARILCEVALGNEAKIPSGMSSASISQDFTRWYWRLVEFGAEPTVLQLHATVDSLERTLPAAAELVRSVIAKLGLVETV